MSKETQHKVVLSCEYEDSDEIDIETPWADYLGDDKYQLKNFPFFFYGLSFDDIFEAKVIEGDDDRPHFIKVVEKSGHKTIRIFFEESVKESKTNLKILESVAEMGCGYEGNGASFFVINIQPHCDFWQVCNYLTDNKVQWEHADPTYDEIWNENT